MKLREALEKISDVLVNDDFVSDIENLYEESLSDELKKIVSLNRETEFYDDRDLLRALSNTEVLNATEDLSVDFVGISLLPLFDVGDNDFVCFDFNEKCWYLFNIVDEVKFKKSASIVDYL
jgi:hydrogenase maturation factor HypE